MWHSMANVQAAEGDVNGDDDAGRPHYHTFVLPFTMPVSSRIPFACVHRFTSVTMFGSKVQTQFFTAVLFLLEPLVSVGTVSSAFLLSKAAQPSDLQTDAPNRLLQYPSPVNSVRYFCSTFATVAVTGLYL